MPVRNQPITPYNSSSSGRYDKHEKEPPVKVYSKTSNFKKSPTSDSLYKSLAGKPPRLPANTHPWRHSGISKPSGANYKPSQEYGAEHQVGKGRNVYTYGKAPGGRGENAVPGGGPNGRGRAGNSLGNAPNKRGTNANMYPRISNRSGGNAVPGEGPDGNRRSSNAVSGRSFYPRFGGHKP